ncbi:MAG: hypothetical protein II264_03110 [Ruminococcus sp.]|nr:hypothetical protein [Ruminococcus sp.]
MDNNFNNDNVQPNQVPNPEQTPQGKDYSAQFAQYNQPRNGFDNQNTDANPYQQPAQPDYNQYQPQQPAQPDYYNQYQNNPVQPYDYNQAGYQQPEYQQGNVYNAAPAEGPTGAAKVFSIISLVCGIISVVFGCCGWGILFGIPGAVFGIISKAKCGAKNPLALVGMILSFVGIGLSIIMIVVMCVSGNSSFSTPYSSYNW